MSVTTIITVGGVRMTKAAFATLAAGVLASIILTVTMPYGWIAGIAVMLISMLSAYKINCMVVGHCNIFATLLMVLFIIHAGLTALAGITKHGVRYESIKAGVSKLAHHK